MMKKILSITMVVALALTALLSCAAPALAASSYKVRATASVNLRTGPGLGYAKVTSVKSGTTLSYTGVSRFDSRGAAWHRVTYNGSTVWISWLYSNLMGDGVAISETYAVRAKASLNVRKGAGTSYGKITTVSSGTNMVYLGETATVSGTKWYKVSTSAGIGWVSGAYSSLVSVPYVKPQSSSSSSSTSTGTRVLTTGSVNLRTGPGLNYASVSTASSGKYLTYLGASQRDGRGVTWYKVSSSKGAVWVSSRYARLV